MRERRADFEPIASTRDSGIRTEVHRYPEETVDEENRKFLATRGIRRETFRQSRSEYIVEREDSWLTNGKNLAADRLFGKIAGIGRRIVDTSERLVIEGSSGARFKLKVSA